MKFHVVLLFVACAVMISTTGVSAQPPVADGERNIPVNLQPPTGPVPLSAEMWLYLHEQQREDSPEMVVRRNAQQKSQARRNRIAARKWFGYSAARPKANPTPWTSQYSATWSGNGLHPLNWQGSGSYSVAVQVDGTQTRR
jgi:hypothetical protein